MNASNVAFAREIRRMETEEVKRLTFAQMLAYAVYETRTILADMRESEIVEVMEAPPEGGLKRTAKHRMRSRAVTGRVDAGTISRPGKREWRGMNGHAAKVRKHKAQVQKARKREQSYGELLANPIGGFIHLDAN